MNSTVADNDLCRYPLTISTITRYYQQFLSDIKHRKKLVYINSTILSDGNLAKQRATICEENYTWMLISAP